ncbi:MAG: ABC-F family ATP-binding cassette domain-containing protein [Rhizobacter sp.]|nr:ABC-F family ATP-binding cassette domain-containing protein [Chlorobiales bacterium]
MNILAVQDLSKTFGLKTLFKEVSFGMDEADKIGVIGANGSGKSTLLKVIAGLDTADGGKVMTATGKVITYLSQNPAFTASDTVLQAVLAANREAFRLIEDYETACNDLAVVEDAAEQSALESRVATLADKIESAGAWQLESGAKVILGKLGITDFDATMETLSGGQRKRVALAHALVAPSDLLILDEPTNHLDADGAAWLETYLQRNTRAVLLVTHDRYFLDRVATRIIELDRQTLQTFAGNYAYYLEKKAEQEEQREVEGRKRDALAKSELAWLRKGAKARTTKQKARVDRAEALINAPKEKAKETLEIALGSERLGNKSIEFHGVSKSYNGKLLIDRFSYNVKKGDRLGIIGANGAGKSTLVEMITGNATPDAGHIEIGKTVTLGYYDQESTPLVEEQRVIDYILEAAGNIKLADGSLITASQMLERFLFSPQLQYSRVATLSGGERRRLYLLRVLMANPNVLILDEPTNDLDIPTLVTLEDYLENFAGVLIVISHDRYFLDRTIDHLFRFEGNGKLRNYPGNYSMFLEMQQRENASPQSSSNEFSRPPKLANAGGAVALAAKQNEFVNTAARKLSGKEKQELKRLESEIAADEARKSKMESELSEQAENFARVQTLCAEIETLTKSLDLKLTRWSELSEFA